MKDAAIDLDATAAAREHASIDPAAGRKAIVAASAGNALEWYDFTVYALFAVYIGKNFFKNDDPAVQLMGSFLAFGLGFVVRPLGALILGSYADRVGRKAALMMTISMMACGTLLIAVAPPYAAIGLGAPLLIVLGRVLQGFSAGGEVGGATAFLVEHAPPGKRGQYASWLQASMGISNLLGAGVATAVTSILSEEQVGSWGWRIPFILGLGIAPVGLWMRRALDETPHFREEQERQSREGKPKAAPLLSVVKNYRKELVTGVGISVLWAVAPYSLIIYMPIYAQQHMGFTSSETFSAALVGNVFLISGCLFAGTLSDRFGRLKMLRLGAGLLLVSVYPLMAWLATTHTQVTLTFGAYPLTAWLETSHAQVTLTIVQSLFCLLVSLFVGVAPAALAEIFPTAVRSSGMSLSYNISVTIFGGFAPAILTWITYRTHVAHAPALYVMAASLAALASSFLYKPEG